MATNELYTIQASTVTPLFDQIRRITETEDAMTFEGATESLLNITPGGDLPSAEERSFGRSAGAEYGISFDASKVTKYNYSGYYTAYTEYEAKEAFQLLGVRVYVAGTPSDAIDIDISLNGVTKGSFYLGRYSASADAWNVFYFEQPFNVAVGDKIKIWQDNITYPYRVYKSNVTFNGKIAYSDGMYSDSVWGIYDVIIGAVETDIPDEYSITRTTMDNIAVEVQRISGTTTKMTTSQMLTALQSITLQDKTVTPTAEVQTVTPDDGYYALSSVTVEAIPTTE